VPLPCTIGGRGWRLVPFGVEAAEGRPEHYDVRLDGPRSSCECLGHLRHGQRTTCKHVAALLALTAAGQLPA
jgi:hypothetical protein